VTSTQEQYQKKRTMNINKQHGGSISKNKRVIVFPGGRPLDLSSISTIIGLQSLADSIKSQLIKSKFLEIFNKEKKSCAGVAKVNSYSGGIRETHL